MAPIRMQASTDGPKLTVAGALQNPRFLPERTLRTMENQFLVDGLFRPGPPAQGGAVGYTLNQPRYADNEPEVVAEYGEIPIVSTKVGEKRSARTVKKGAALAVSQEMRDRNDVATLNDRMTMVRNTFVRHYDRQFMSIILNHPDVQEFDVGTPWTATAGTTIRRDLSQAGQMITDASVPGLGADQFFDYEADTLVVPTTVSWSWLNSDEINELFKGGALASEDMRYSGKLLRKLFGFNVAKARALDGTNTALVMQRGIAGFISDERPMQATPMYEDKPTETWRSDFTRMSVAKLDNPLAVVRLRGVEA